MITCLKQAVIHKRFSETLSPLDVQLYKIHLKLVEVYILAYTSHFVVYTTYFIFTLCEVLSMKCIFWNVVAHTPKHFYYNYSH